MTTTKRALLFSGQGAQKVGMGADLSEHSAAARQLYAEADKTLGWSLSDVSFRGPVEKLTETRVCQPALYVHGLALLAAAQEVLGRSLRFEAAAGLSLGEYTAHAAASTFTFATGLGLVAERGRLMQEACEATQGTMITLLGATPEQARDIAAAAGVDVANLNCPGQIVLSGGKKESEAVPALAKEKGVRKVIPLQVAGAYHSRLMASAAAGLEPFLKKADISAPRVPIVANFSAEITEQPEAIRAALLAQVCGSVRWEESVRLLIAQGFTEFIEFGPGGVIAGMIKRIDPAVRCLSIETHAQLLEHKDLL